MRFALLGADRDAVDLVHAAIASGNELASVYQAPSFHAEIRAAAPRARWDDQWESLLHGSVADAVIVASGARLSHSQQELRADQLRKLAQMAMPLIAVHPACESIIGYELEMIRVDTQALLLAYHPSGDHPGLVELADMIRLGPDGPCGSVEQVVMERFLSDREPPQVLGQLARDADLLRKTLGEISKVSAMGASQRENAWTNLSVHMSGAAGILARWSVGPVNTFSGAQLTLLGSSGKVQLDMPGDQTWTLHVRDAPPRRLDPWAAPQQAIDAAVDAIGQHQPTGSNWIDACRACEIAESAQRSLERGRHVELHNEEPTEEATFKGLMAIGSCGLLLLAVLVLLVASVVEGIRLPRVRSRLQLPRPDVVQDQDNAGQMVEQAQRRRSPLLLRLWPVYPFALLLLLQLLRFVFRSRPPSGRGPG